LREEKEWGTERLLNAIPTEQWHGSVLQRLSKCHSYDF